MSAWQGRKAQLSRPCRSPLRCVQRGQAGPGQEGIRNLLLVKKTSGVLQRAAPGRQPGAGGLSLLRRPASGEKELTEVVLTKRYARSHR